jgi:isopentenyldiphosphate isomerase
MMPPAPPGDEWLDRVDDHDVVLGPLLRSETLAKGFCNFRVINAFLRNKAGQIWVPRRSAGKRLFPLCLDCSVGGHVGSGENYEEAFFRETAEEIGVDLRRVPWRFLGKVNPHSSGLSAFMQVYEISSEAVPDYNRNDFIEWFWLTPAELMEKIRSGEPAKGDLLGVVQLFYGQP